MRRESTASEVARSNSTDGSSARRSRNPVPLNPIGFAPSEISALVNDSVVSRHAEEAAFLWTQRHRAVTEPHFSLNDLAVLDERVEAQRAGLVEAGEIGWRC